MPVVLRHFGAASHVALIVLSSCTEYGAHSLVDGEEPASVPTDSAWGVIEVCNARDDDGDGRVDDGHDANASGKADCLECAVGEPSSTAPPESACVAPAVSGGDIADIVELWDFTPDSSYGCRAAIGNLDADAAPEVICASHEVVYALDGATGAVEWEYRGDPERYAPVAVADVDADGEMEVVTVNNSGQIVALGSDGLEKWTTTSSFSEPVYSSLAIMDLDGNGDAEVLTMLGIVRGQDGGRAAWWDLDTDYYWIRDVITANLDLTGPMESLTAWGAFDATGASVGSTEIPPGWEYFAVPVALQADGDDDGEVAWISDSHLTLVDADGTVVLQSTLPEQEKPVRAHGCAADLDGDGLMEILYSDYEMLRALRVDGTIVWQQPIRDNNNYLACSVFDLNGDGSTEVFLADQQFVRIFDSSGTELWKDHRKSVSVHDIVMHADLNGDHSTELIVTNPAGSDGTQDDAGIRVYSHRTGGWAPAWPFWPHDSWSGSGLWPDGSVDPDPEPPWLAHGIWRGQPPWRPYGADLVPEVAASCASELDVPDGEVRLLVRVANLGPQDLPNGTSAAVYSFDDEGNATVLQLLTFSDALPSGDRTTEIEVVTTREQAVRGLQIVVGDEVAPLTTHDCDEDNNTLTWTLP